MWNFSSFNFSGQGSSNAQQPVSGSFLRTGDQPVTTIASFVMPSVIAETALRGNREIQQQQGNDHIGILGGYSASTANDTFSSGRQIATFVPSLALGNQFDTSQAPPNQLSTPQMETNVSAVLENPFMQRYTPYPSSMFFYAPPEQHSAEMGLPDYSRISPNPLNTFDFTHGSSFQNDPSRFGTGQEPRRATPETENNESGAPLSKKPRFSPRGFGESAPSGCSHRLASVSKAPTVSQYETFNFSRTIKLEPSDVDYHATSLRVPLSSSEVSMPILQSSAPIATTETPPQKQNDVLMRTVKQETTEKALADWDNIVKNISTVTNGCEQEKVSALTKTHQESVDDTSLIGAPILQTEDPVNLTNPMRRVQHKKGRDSSMPRLSSEPAVFDNDTAAHEVVPPNDRSDFHMRNVKQELLEEPMPTLRKESQEDIPEGGKHISALVLKMEEQEVTAVEIIQNQPEAEIESIRSIPQQSMVEETAENRNGNGEEQLIEDPINVNDNNERNSRTDTAKTWQERIAPREEEELDEESSSTISSSSEESETSVEELEDEDQHCSLGELCIVGDYFRRFTGEVTQSPATAVESGSMFAAYCSTMKCIPAKLLYVVAYKPQQVQGMLGMGKFTEGFTRLLSL
ncbi:hypothetical protein CRE_27682 [Caenorhabditis remanei]|uniref:Uncharacterized protein n=1 Tax=Caenorhabditis remanei TaxID=31234 RepID=E3MKH3_CAERE|nr:hypothetical protein CRE_27682 [Caenorhabditis remanei]